MISIQNLRKSYGNFTAVEDVSFETAPGEIFGLLGPNGAGKSTTIGCISGLLAPSGGRIEVDGHDTVTDARAARRALGIVPQELALYEDLPAVDNLRYWGAAYGLRGAELASRVRETLQVTGLTDRACDKPKTFSGGMKRRLNFGCGIVHEPRVLLLDEPTVGVDPQSRERLFDMVRAQTARGATVLYTTHHMEEAENLCDSLAIVDTGRLIARGTLEDLRAEIGEKDIVTLSGEFAPDLVRSDLASGWPDAPIGVLQAEAGKLFLEMTDGPARIAAILENLVRAGARITETVVRRPNLESLFLKLTGSELRS